jgi:hypothetical protein
VAAASREALRARQPGSSTVARRCGPNGQDESTEVTAVSTITIVRPEELEVPPEWRRLCHIYLAGALRSACGTATRKPDEGHYEDECAARGHTTCVVCAEVWERVHPRI